jgi:23S rRNA (adenine2503-C2)-methyltransferase
MTEIPSKPAADSRPALRGMTVEDLAALLTSGGFPAYRAKQLFHWIYRHSARSFDEMTTLPKDMRAWLAEHTQFGGIAGILAEKTSADGSTKFLFEFEDGLKIESVLMPGVGEQPDRMTLCISSQVGCAVDCKFCVTGKNGFFRHMTTAEIVDQALYARHYLARLNDGRLLRNIVFMGMGEPLLNTANVIPAIRLFLDGEGMDFSPRRVTVSTSGILPGLQELIDSGTNAALAISLNAPTKELREEIMPITRKYPLEDLLEMCREMELGTRRITFEYVLMKGINDGERHARQVIRAVHGIPCKMNVIPYNPDPSLPYERPDDATIDAFCATLRSAHLTVSVRWSKAQDVSGACGQLAGQYRQKTTDGKRVVLPREPAVS